MSKHNPKHNPDPIVNVQVIEPTGHTILLLAIAAEFVMYAPGNVHPVLVEHIANKYHHKFINPALLYVKLPNRQPGTLPSGSVESPSPDGIWYYELLELWSDTLGIIEDYVGISDPESIEAELHPPLAK